MFKTSLWIRNQENFEVVYFLRTEPFWNFRGQEGLSFRRGLYLLEGTWYVLAHKMYQKNNNFLFPLFFIKIWWKSYIFPRIPVTYFLRSLFLCNCPEVYITRLCYTCTCYSPGHDIKRPGKVHFWLVRLIWDRQMLVTATKNNKYLKIILYYF